jgi:hypothetical protein
VIPQESSAGKTISLLKEISVSGRDTFISKDVKSVTVSTYTTEDIEDPIVETTDGKVAK